jgi:hypothetical protein
LGEDFWGELLGAVWGSYWGLGVRLNYTRAPRVDALGKDGEERWRPAGT